MKAFLAICFFAIPLTTTTTSTVAGAQAGRRVWIGESRIEADDGSVVIPLMIDDIGEVVAGDIDLLILGEVTGGIDVRRTELLKGFLLLHNVVGDTLKISFASLQPNTGSGAFAEGGSRRCPDTPRFHDHLSFTERRRNSRSISGSYCRAVE